MNKYTNKLRKKYKGVARKKHTNRKNKRKTKIIIEQRFKNLNAKTVKALQEKFKKERLLLENKHIVNREQIGCSNNKNMKGGIGFLTDVIQKVEDVGTNTYNSMYGYSESSNQDPTHQPYLANMQII
jgi:hypothetical protein